LPYICGLPPPADCGDRRVASAATGVARVMVDGVGTPTSAFEIGLFVAESVNIARLGERATPCVMCRERSLKGMTYTPDADHP